MKTLWQRGWQASPPLMVTGLLMLLDLAVCLAGLAFDSRTITGVPAWLKPAKFAISVALYTFTLAWILSYVTRSPRLVRVLAWLTCANFVLEIVIIDVQATRGVTSHFNTSTTLNRVLYSTMGASIAILWLAGIVIAVLLFRQHFEDRAFGWSLRLGVLVSMIGAVAGIFMTAPTRAQLEQARLTHNLPIAGAHTVGAPDGGPGVPGTGWSTEHGDMRVAHFLGLHGMQILPLIAWFTRKRRTTRTIQLAAVSYVSLFAILIWQALRGQSVVEPDSTTLLVLAVWAASTLIAVLASTHRGREMTLATR
jgi:hypothetical protein